MLTIKTPFIRALLLVVLMPVAAWAQTASKAQGLEWPRLLSGQPDFAFTRGEAFQEALSKANRDGTEAPKAYGLADLMDDKTELDPLGLERPIVSSTLAGVADAAAASGTAPIQAVIDPLMANVMALPSLNTSYTLDLSEFKASLVHALSSTVAGWRPQTGGFSFGDVANGLVLQAIVTSPEKYAVINDQRYAEGDTFQLRLPVAVPDTEINSALQTRLPVSGTLSADVAAQYQKAYEEVLGAFYAARSANPSLGQQAVMVPVNIKAIEPRKVVLDIRGEEHVLQVRFAY